MLTVLNERNLSEFTNQNHPFSWFSKDFLSTKKLGCSLCSHPRLMLQCEKFHLSSSPLWLWKPELKSLWCMIMSLFCFLRCSYISYNGMPVFNFAEHCSEQTKPLSSGQTIDYDDPTQALILENTIHHTTEAEDFVRIKRGHPLNASVWLSDSETDIFLVSSHTLILPRDFRP